MVLLKIPGVTAESLARCGEKMLHERERREEALRQALALLKPAGPATRQALERILDWYEGNLRDRGEAGGVAAASKALLRIQKAASLAKPGDTVYVMNGVYTDDASNVLTIIRSGNKDAWITYQAFPGHSPKIKSKDWNAIKIEGASYIKIDGLELEGNADNIKLEYALSEKENKKNPATASMSWHTSW